MKKFIIAIALLNIITSCNSQIKKDYVGEWFEVKQIKGEYVIVNCGYNGEVLKVSDNAIVERGIIENTNFKISHIKNNDQENILFTNKNEKSYFKFIWLNKAKGVAKWQIVQDDSKTEKYFVLKEKVKGIKTIKGTKADCITGDEVGDKVNDSIVLNNNSTFLIEDDNCILLKNNKQEVVVENCFENTIIKIRHLSKDYIPLTFISGQQSMDIDFLYGQESHNQTFVVLCFSKNEHRELLLL